MPQRVPPTPVFPANTASAIDLRDPTLTAAAVCAALQLQPHPEGGHYRETWRHQPGTDKPRGDATTILFLLAEGERSHWHRVDASEIWLWQAGAPLRLRMAAAEDAATQPAPQPYVLGPETGQHLQAVVTENVWQAAETLGRWSLVGCVVAPAFQFSGFELAPPGWEPHRSVEPDI